MKAPFSPYLLRIKPGLKQLVALLRRDYDYVSVLATDSVGLTVSISRRARSVGSETMSTERGVVVRLYRGGQYREYALNEFDPDRAEETAARIEAELAAQQAVLDGCGTQVYDTAALSDEPLTLFVERETEQLPETTDVKALVDRLTALSDHGMELDERMIECIARAQSTHVCKLFLTEHRDLSQSYVYSEGVVVPVMRGEDGSVQNGYEGVSGLCGPELFTQLDAKLESGVAMVRDLLTAEAFGHGVEMDMFVKNRALGKDYVGKRVGSDLVTMHEGALCAENVTSYAFDDEGTAAGDVIEIDRGILKTGICDALSALRLGIAPTGNGKRQNFEHKVYTRMTNTIFDSGDDRLEDMIASVKHGYLLEGMESGMEDPKHWGIQCIIKKGREIRDGVLTGKVVAPIIMTGYVPDLLGGISMCSRDREIFGNGGCGKGYKEWVKVADGGPYLKTKARLG